jgi:DNA-binding NarL/FixJ family response regulator
LALSRRVQDSVALAGNLHVMLDVLWGPEKTAERLDYATEMLRLCEAAPNHDLIPEAYFWRFSCLLELGATHELEAAVDGHVRLAEALRQPFYRYITTGVRAMQALFAGRFAEGERLALQAYALGRRVRAENVDSTYGLQMFTLRREQGRLGELEPAVRRFVQQHGMAAIWGPGLALLYGELGRESEAREAFERLASDDFAAIPRDALWVTCLVYLAEVCAFLRDAERAAILYHLLQPYRGRNVVVGRVVACYGAVDRYLGLLASTISDWTEAEQHFTAALALNMRLGTKPWLAHTQYDYASMLLDRGQPEDFRRARALFEESLDIARELGMRTLEEHAVARLDPSTAPTSTFASAPDGLTPREIEVLRLLALGKSNRGIADALCVSLSTVATHVRNILSKTETANRTEAAAYALRRGHVPPHF